MTQEEDITTYRQKIEKLTENLDDDSLLGYSEAILNLLGEFTNGQCADCPFSREVECYSPDFIYPEIDLRCRLNECWIDTIKKLFKNKEIKEIHNGRYTKIFERSTINIYRKKNR